MMDLLQNIAIVCIAAGMLLHLLMHRQLHKLHGLMLGSIGAIIDALKVQARG